MLFCELSPSELTTEFSVSETEIEQDTDSRPLILFLLGTDDLPLFLPGTPVDSRAEDLLLEGRADVRPFQQSMREFRWVAMENRFRPQNNTDSHFKYRFPPRKKLHLVPLNLSLRVVWNRHTLVTPSTSPRLRSSLRRVPLYKE